MGFDGKANRSAPLAGRPACQRLKCVLAKWDASGRSTPFHLTVRAYCSGRIGPAQALSAPRKLRDYAMGDLLTKGGPVMWPLLACSIVSLTVTIERLTWQWRNRRRRSNPDEQIIEHAQHGRLHEAMTLAEQGNDPVTGVLVAGLRHQAHGLTDAMQIASQAHLTHMKRGLNILDTIITLAPLLGILGTVTGIIQSFDLLGQAGLEEPQAVVGGIAQALVTTAAGLSIAVCTLIPFNWLVGRVRQSADDMQTLATRLELACRQGAEVQDASN
jgi:biopolymer transport protein ExbB